MQNALASSTTTQFYVAQNGNASTQFQIINSAYYNGSSPGRFQFSFKQGLVQTPTLYANGTLIGSSTQSISAYGRAVMSFSTSPSFSAINVNGSSNVFPGVTLPALADTTLFQFGDTRQAYSTDIQIYEVLFFDTQLSDTATQLIEGYLAWKWRLATYLPNSHPYKTHPPTTPNPTSPLPFHAINMAPLIYPQMTTTPRYWLPTNVPSCMLWLDAADPSVFVLTQTNKIVVWNDKSGVGNTTYNPTDYPTLSSNILNGQKTVLFNGTSTYMANTASINGAQHTFFAVHKPYSALQNKSLIRLQTTPPSYVIFPYGSNGYVTTQDSTALTIGNSQLVDNSVPNTFNLIVANITYGSQQIFLNGALQSSASQPLSFFIFSPMYIGSYAGTSDFYAGELAELIVYTNSITKEQQQKVEGYLAWKWGLQASLPKTHPYAVFPPVP